MVNTAWANAHRDTVKKFHAAYQKAVDWFYDTKNKDEAVAIAVSLTKGNPKVLGGTYDSLRKLQFFAKTDVVPKQHLENLIEIVNELGQLDHPIQPEQLVLAGVTHYVDK
jgi:ABC-type nitrate/sulfonate/bicarbonate transport system substrate-binding protein